jgi:hypothetical protein
MRVPECSSQRQGWLPAPLNVNPFTVEPDLDTVEVWGSSPGPPPHSLRKFLVPVGRKLGSGSQSRLRELTLILVAWCRSCTVDVYLVDGTYELFRHYYALPSARDEDGREAVVRGVLSFVGSAFPVHCAYARASA